MFQTKPEVKVIADSIWEGCPRLTTIQLKYWRPLLPEMNTHRVFSRNAASSRAQSFQKKCKEIKDNLYLPEHWNSEKAGMTGGEEFTKEEKDFINKSIADLSYKVMNHLFKLNSYVQDKTGYRIHKQYLNRYLEPFCPVVQLITSTDWNNFFKLRLSSDAQPEMRDVAWEIQQALETNFPDEESLHLPYVTPAERSKYSEQTCFSIAVARCARVSYKAYEGDEDLERDLYLFERLKNSGHWSPFEHIATADPKETAKDKWRNFDHWIQYRATLDENS